MAWTTTDYPVSMKNLEPKIRSKAIEIANALLEEGYDEGSAIPIAISTAHKWAQGDSDGKAEKTEDQDRSTDKTKPRKGN
jgi:uncharacterized protein YdaT